MGKEVDAGRILKVAPTLKTRPLEWPSDRLANFQDCDLNAVTCCFTREGQQDISSDNANSKACTHDYADSQRSSHTKNGITDYGELDAYCVGFACAEGDNGLVEYYEGLFPEETEKIEALEKKIVNTCEEGASSFWKEYGYAKGSAWWHASSDTWTPLSGHKFLYYPTITQDDFQKAYQDSDTKIIRRVCTSCKVSHRDTYYRRVASETQLPDGLDFVEVLTSSFQEENNQMGTHFNIYSTYEDALARQNPWLFCNYSSNKGYPSECGPTAQTTKQWSSKNGGTYGTNFAYYLEK